MYEKSMLDLNSCFKAIDAMTKEFNRDPSRSPVDMAIVDDMGNLLAYARMDRCNRPTFALRKAYTSAVRGSNTGAFAERLAAQGRSLADIGDPQLITTRGGVVIRNPKDGSVLGAIGVGGLPSGEDDEKIAEVGLQALDLER